MSSFGPKQKSTYCVLGTFLELGIQQWLNRDSSLPPEERTLQSGRSRDGYWVNTKGWEVFMRKCKTGERMGVLDAGGDEGVENVNSRGSFRSEVSLGTKWKDQTMVTCRGNALQAEGTEGQRSGGRHANWWMRGTAWSGCGWSRMSEGERAEIYGERRHGCSSRASWRVRTWAFTLRERRSHRGLEME